MSRDSGTDSANGGWLRRLGIGPTPISKSSNKIIVWTSLITVSEWFNLKLLKHFESLKHTDLDRVR